MRVRRTPRRRPRRRRRREVGRGQTRARGARRRRRRGCRSCACASWRGGWRRRARASVARRRGRGSPGAERRWGVPRARCASRRWRASPGADGQGVEARRAGTVRVVERLGDALDDLHLGPRRRRRWIVGVARETKRRAQLRQGLHPPPVFRREDHVHDGSRVVGTVVGGERTRREVLREGGAVRHDAARARIPEKRGRRLPEPRARQGVCRKTRTTRVVRRGTRLHHI